MLSAGNRPSVHDNVTFDDAPEDDTINFRVGRHSGNLLPVELTRAAADDYLRTSGAFGRNAGATRPEVG